MTQELLHIPVDHITVPVSVRVLTDKHVAALAESIKAEGLHTPINVFTTDKPGQYVLGAGGHRLAAVKSLGHTEIAALCLGPYKGVAGVRAVQLSENIQRENMDPIEEALAFEKQLEDRTDQELADALGRPLAYVQQRLALLALTPESRESLVAKRITLRHAQLLAKIGDKEQQNDLLDRCQGEGRADAGGPGHKDRDEYVPPMDTEILADLVHSRQRDLGAVGWDLAVPFGSENRDCATCPFNSKNRPELFIDGGKKGVITCGDSSCFDDKRTIAGRKTRSVAWRICKDGINGVPASKQNVKSCTTSIVVATREAMELPFVTVKAVKEILPDIFQQQRATVDRAMTGAKKAAKKPGEKPEGWRAHQAQEERKREINRKYKELLGDWCTKAWTACLAQLVVPRYSGAYLLLLTAHPLWSKADNGKLNKPGKDRTVFIGLLKGALQAKTAADLAAVAGLLNLAEIDRAARRGGSDNALDSMLSEIPSEFMTRPQSWNDESPIIYLMIEAYGVNTMEFGAKPTPKDAEAVLFPKAVSAPKSEKPAKSKRKAA